MDLKFLVYDGTLGSGQISHRDARDSIGDEVEAAVVLESAANGGDGDAGVLPEETDGVGLVPEAVDDLWRRGLSAPC